MTQRLSALPPVSAAHRDRILAAPRTVEEHRSLLKETDAMNAVQVGGEASVGALPGDLTVVAWNVERCLFPEETAAHLAPLSPDVVLLSEVDHGMARTAQRHTTEGVATALGMSYAYGVEFFEMDLGGETERQFCKDDFNALGFHGNAILARVPLERVAMVRLDDAGHWFVPQAGATDPGQPRIGGRMALLAELSTEAGKLTVVSTHLESNADAAFRRTQFELLLDAVEDFAPTGPVLIGGDLNTGNHLPPDFDWRNEDLFSRGEKRGFSWGFTADGPTTRPSLITPHPDRVMKLDWIAGRGVACKANGVLSSISEAGTPLSDHDAVWAQAVIA
ncbi:MAG: endonuclease/exonuclease/phosphatase family protein [Rhodobacteraceae bacterium]|nr:endonuclease/exonuclease/phosphatase family protein [Paracoccaceae bacterium]